MWHQFIYQIILDFLYNIIICTLEHVQGLQIHQIWRILSQNFLDESAEVTEGVTSTPEIFGNKQGATLTPVRNTVTVLSSLFFATNIIYINCKRCKPQQNTDKINQRFLVANTFLKCGPSFKIFHCSVFVVFVVFHGLVIYAFFLALISKHLSSGLDSNWL